MLSSFLKQLSCIHDICKYFLVHPWTSIVPLYKQNNSKMTHLENKILKLYYDHSPTISNFTFQGLSLASPIEFTNMEKTTQFTQINSGWLVAYTSKTIYSVLFNNCFTFGPETFNPESSISYVISICHETHLQVLYSHQKNVNR